jgi:hypothetical protein
MNLSSFIPQPSTFIAMAISAIVTIQGDTATPALTALLEAMDVRAISANVGEAEVILFQRHFGNAPENKMGWESTGFWKDAVRATNYQVVAGGVAIGVNQVGVRQRFAGGEIHPVKGNYLAIPARAEAYGKAPGEWDNLKVAFGRNGAFALVEADATQITYGKKSRNTGLRDFTSETVGGGVYYWLVKSVYQAPDPSVLPADRDIQQVAEETINDLLKRVGGQS